MPPEQMPQILLLLGRVPSFPGLAMRDADGENSLRFPRTSHAERSLVCLAESSPLTY